MRKHRENLLEEAAGVLARPSLPATIATAAVLHADPHKLALSAVDRYRAIVTENYGVNNQVEG
jgi:hypothetical protein